MADLSLITRRQWLYVGGGLVLQGLMGCAGKSSEPIWIGHLARLSGKSTDGGERAIDAMQLTLADLRARDFTIAGRTLGVRHVDAPTKERARAEATRLLAINRVACLIVGPGVEGVSEIVAVARSHGAAVVVLGEVADTTLADQGLLLGADPFIRGEMLARFAIASGKGKRAAILRDRGEKIAGLVADGFEREYRRKDGSIDSSSAEDARADLDRLRRKTKPQVIVAAMNEVSWIKWLNSDVSGLPPVLYGGPLASPLVGLENASKKGELWWPTLQPDPAKLSADSREWFELFKKRFHQRPTDDAILAHDAIALVADGLQAIGGDDRPKLAKELTGRTTFDGLTGTITWKEGRPIRPLFLVRFVNGKRQSADALPTT